MDREPEAGGWDEGEQGQGQCQDGWQVVGQDNDAGEQDGVGGPVAGVVFLEQVVADPEVVDGDQVRGEVGEEAGNPVGVDRQGPQVFFRLLFHDYIPPAYEDSMRVENASGALRWM